MTCFHVNVRCKFILFITDYVIVESGLLWHMEPSNPSACSNDSTYSYLSVSRTHPLVIAELVRYYALLSRSPPSPPPPPPPPAPSVSYDLMPGRVACARRVFPHEGSSEWGGCTSWISTRSDCKGPCVQPGKNCSRSRLSSCKYYY